MSQTTQAIAELVKGRLVGPADLEIEALAEIDQAKSGQLTFIGDAKYASKWALSKASAAIVGEDIELEPGDSRAFIVVDNADLAMAMVLAAYEPPKPMPPKGIHPSTLIAETATIGEGCRIGPNCIIKPGAKIGDNSVLHANVTVYADSSVGEGCELWPNVVIRERCTVGDRCILHSGVIIGTDGFGYRVDKSGDHPVVVKVPQIGTVQIGNDCEIGANSCVDRAKFDATVLGHGCKLDNLVQIGHNCRLGNMVVISGCVGIGGSCIIGDGTLIGGKAMLKDHVTLGRGCSIAGGAAVINDVPDGEAWGGYPAAPLKEKIREELAIKKLPDLMKKVKKYMKDL